MVIWEYNNHQYILSCAYLHYCFALTLPQQIKIASEAHLYPLTQENYLPCLLEL